MLLDCPKVKGERISVPFFTIPSTLTQQNPLQVSTLLNTSMCQAQAEQVLILAVWCPPLQGPWEDFYAATSLKGSVLHFFHRSFLVLFKVLHISILSQWDW